MAGSRGADERIRLATLALHFSLIALVALWQLVPAVTVHSILLAVAFTAPLWLPTRGLLRGTRRTYGWATLCVIPYLVLGITEVIANPRARVWAALCLLLAFLLFAMLVAYLRVTRSAPASISRAPSLRKAP